MVPDPERIDVLQTHMCRYLGISSSDHEAEVVIVSQPPKPAHQQSRIISGIPPSGSDTCRIQIRTMEQVFTLSLSGFLNPIFMLIPDPRIPSRAEIKKNTFPFRINIGNHDVPRVIYVASSPLQPSHLLPPPLPALTDRRKTSVP